jgi:hypothetical protein
MIKTAALLAEDARDMPWWLAERVADHVAPYLNFDTIVSSPHQQRMRGDALIDPGRPARAIILHIKDGLEAALPDAEWPIRAGRPSHPIHREAIRHLTTIYGLYSGKAPTSTPGGSFSCFCADVFRSIGWVDAADTLDHFLAEAVAAWKVSPTPIWKIRSKF